MALIPTILNQSGKMAAKLGHFTLTKIFLLVVSNIIFCVLVVAFSYCGTYYPMLFFLMTASQKGERFHALTSVFALTQSAFVTYTYFAANNL